VSYDRLQPFQQLEAALADWTGCPHVACCSSGTAALHLAIESLLLPFRSEVITADFNMVAVPRAITLANMTPVFVDCGDDLLIDTDRLDEAASTCDRARAVIVTHVYGRRARMDDVHAIAHKHNLLVIEDLAEAHGVPVHPASAAGCWSFYRNKCVHGEEGGAVVYPHPGEVGASRAMLARQLRSLGFTAEHNYEHVARGMNYRLANLLATPILESLANVEASLAARREIEGWYDRHCPDEWRMPKRDSVWTYDLRIPGMYPELQTQIVRALQAEGIAARVAFKPMSSQEEFRYCRTFGTERAARASRECLYLPCDPGKVTEATAVKAFEVIRRAVAV
jgi:dTDP-4-amino-4,6-dideoxygalactose transaminase